jgi:hypothetical protein
MRSTVIVAMVGITVVTGARMSAAQEAPAPSPPAVRLLVANRAKLRPEMLKEAEADATTVSRAAGVQTTWENVGADVSYDHAVDFTVMIVSGKETRVMAAHLRNTVMGFTVSHSTDHGGRGGTAFVLFDRVEDSAAKHHVLVSRVLGEVIAHELGHLLLPFNSHSDRGIMRDPWDLRSGLLEYFTSAQAETIRQRLTERAESVASRNSK